MTWTSVVSYHTDPEGCGVARFSAQLAARLGVPFVGALDRDRWGTNPLLSVKWSEWKASNQNVLRFDKLMHDEPPAGYVSKGRVWKLYEIGVPALVERRYMAGRALFTFGMAHKVDLDKFLAVRAHFPEQQLWISSAAHEGAGPSRVPELVEAWGDARDLGHLSDAALQLVWPRCRAFLAFFEKGLRANNSSVHAALNEGVPVVTNWGPETPHELKLRTTDYRDLGRVYLQMPTDSPYTWTRLLKELGC